MVMVFNILVHLLMAKYMEGEQNISAITNTWVNSSMVKNLEKVKFGKITAIHIKDHGKTIKYQVTV